MYWYPVIIFAHIVTVQYAQELSFKQYTVSDGLKQMQINHLSKDSMGNIWISTRGGISKFNGKSFDNFDDISCMPKYAAATIFTNGKVYTLRGEYLTIIDQGNCYEYEIPHKFKAARGTKLFSSSLGIIGFHYKSNVFLYRDSTFIDYTDTFTELKDKTIYQFDYSERDSQYVFVTKDSLILKYTHNKLTYRKKIDESPVTYLHSRVKLKNGKMLIVTGNSRTYRYNSLKGDSLHLLAEGTPEAIKVYEKEPISSVLMVDSLRIFDHRLYDDITMLNINRWNFTKSIKELSDVTYLSTDKGLIEMSSDLFFNYDEERLTNVWTVIEGEEGEMYAAGFGHGVKRISNDNITAIDVKPYYCHFHSMIHEDDKQFYFGACKDKNGIIYLPSSRGILVMNDGIIDTFVMCRSPERNLASIHSFYDAANHRVVGLNCGDLRLIDIDTRQEVSIPKDRLNARSCLLHGLNIDDSTYGIAYRPHFATYNVMTDSIQIFSHPDTTVKNPAFISTTKDVLGNVWIGSSHGIVIYNPDNNEMTQFPYYQNEMISSIYAYNESKLFLGMGNDLVMINPKEYWQNGTLQAQVYNQSNGFQGIEPNQNGFYLDSKERLWITSSTHLSYTYPKHLQYTQYGMKAQIIRVNGNRVNQNQKCYEIEEGRDAINIEYEIISNPYPQQPEYSYRLNDQQAWSAWTASQHLSLSNLSSGEYELRLRARDAANEQISSHIEYFNFRIDRRLLDEPGIGLKLLLALCVIAGIMGFTLYRNQQLSQKSDLIEENYLLEKANNEQITILKENIDRENKRLQQVIEKQKKTQIKTALISINDKTEMKHDPKDILYTITSKNLSFVHTADGEQYQYWSTVKNILSRLPDNQFVQISRSTIVNTLRIKHINYKYVKMQDDNVLDMSQAGKKRLQDHVDRS